ncbi:hypothetical protein [Maribacter sp. 4G9]|nr:hypothetical protein [Maribacter sp. 4G9]|tara:strand:- start:897 stop:1037 length:141 start_codon:yes stop_codon:yes gene_type:complete
MKYTKPENFKPTAEQMKVAAEELSKHLSKEKVLKTRDGQIIRGKRD